MVSPSMMAGVSLGANVGGTILSAQSAKQQGDVAAKMYTYRAGVAETNRRIALQNKDWALGTGEKEALQYGIKAAQRRGAIVATQAASGTDLGFGTNKQVRTDQDKTVKMDLETIRRNAARVAYGYDIEATQNEAQRSLDLMAASDAKKAANLKVMASYIGGAGSVADKWLQMNQYGVFGSSGARPGGMPGER